MNLQESISFLIDHAIKNVAGVGQGIREEISMEEREKVKHAVRVVWSLTGRPYKPSDDFFRNRGI